MLLSTVPSGDWIHFLQIVGWIVLPVLLASVGITAWMHYRKKRKAPSQLVDLPLHEASPELVGYTRGNGEFILFDHSRLISEYKKQISTQLAKNAALQADMQKLESRLQARGSDTTTASPENIQQPEAAAPHDILMESLADSHKMIALLQQQLEQSQARNRMLEDQIATNRENMRRLYRDFSSQLDREKDVNTASV